MARNRGFTLIEVLVVVAILALLISVLLPSLSRAREQARAAACLSNMRQLGFAAHAYAQSNGGRYPSARYRVTVLNPPSFTLIVYDWDFKTVNKSGVITVLPGLLWPAKTNLQVHQCPSFTGAATNLIDPYTGYNYNTSFIGHIPGESADPNPPMKLSDVRRPFKCAIFGDGQWAQGANKFMRAPWAETAPGTPHDLYNPGDAGFSGRSGGTQGYRHLDSTNVAFCDGHALRWSQRFINTYPTDVSQIAAGTGFLSSTNTAYNPD